MVIGLSGFADRARYVFPGKEDCCGLAGWVWFVCSRFFCVGGCVCFTLLPSILLMYRSFFGIRHVIVSLFVFLGLVDGCRGAGRVPYMRSTLPERGPVVLYFFSFLGSVLLSRARNSRLDLAEGMHSCYGKNGFERRFMALPALWLVHIGENAFASLDGTHTD